MSCRHDKIIHSTRLRRHFNLSPPKSSLLGPISRWKEYKQAKLQRSQPYTTGIDFFFPCPLGVVLTEPSIFSPHEILAKSSKSLATILWTAFYAHPRQNSVLKEAFIKDICLIVPIERGSKDRPFTLSHARLNICSGENRFFNAEIANFYRVSQNLSFTPVRLFV